MQGYMIVCLGLNTTCAAVTALQGIVNTSDIDPRLSDDRTTRISNCSQLPPREASSVIGVQSQKKDGRWTTREGLPGYETSTCWTGYNS